MNEYHVPALLQETIEALNVKPEKKYLDATLGGGGHTEEILKKGGRVLGIDCDPEAIENEKLQGKIQNLTLIRANFKDLKEIAEKNSFNKVAGILFDLGVSSHQLETDDRGFSFNTDARLDMRMDPSLQVSAYDLVNGLNEGELDELFKKYAEEYRSRAIARALVRTRAVKPIRTCNQLAEIIVRARGKSGKFERTHPATRIFQALRMAVNDELNNLRQALPRAVELLEDQGRLVILSFHSLEDRLVKNFFKEEEKRGHLIILTKKPIRPGKVEIATNPRARSAKLRAAEITLAERKICDYAD